MSKLPTPVTVTAEEQARLVRVIAEERGLQQMMAQFQDAFQRRATKFQQDSGEIMRELSAKYGLDTETTQYVASSDGSQLVPTMVRLVTPTQ